MDKFNLSDKAVCTQCVSNPYLKEFMSTFCGTSRPCSYCQKSDADRIDLFILSMQFRHAFDDNYVLADNDLADDMGYPSVGDALIDIVYREVQPMSKELAKDISDRVIEVLGRESFGSEAPSAETLFVFTGASDPWLQRRWTEMRNSLINNARFLNPVALEVLQRVFDDVNSDLTRDGLPLIVEAGPYDNLSTLFRARVFQSDEMLTDALSDPERHLGPPPSNKAVAGRMNAKGISVFYGANEPEVALAEVRPPVGSKVVIAQFNILRNLRLLDLTRFRNVDPIVARNIFDTSTLNKAQRQKFISKLEAELVKPVMPDHSDNGYLVTQVIADYLSTHSELNLDGVIFKSIQVSFDDGRLPLNVVLFNKSSRVKASFKTDNDIVYGDLYSWDFERSDIFKPEIIKFREQEESKVKEGDDDWPSDDDDSEYSLILIPESITIHEVESVKFTTNETPVIISDLNS